MSVILYQYIGMLLLDSLRQLAQHTRTADACHILQTDFGCSRLNELVGNVCIVLYVCTGEWVIQSVACGIMPASSA